MANKDLIDTLNQGIEAWNAWKSKHGRLARSSLHLDFADFSNLDLQGIDFSDTNLRSTNFTGANLSKANFRGANLDKTVFRLADLSYANLRAKSRQADFTGCNLHGGELRNANFNKAIFRGANLSETNLRFSLLINADLRDANLQGAYLSGTNFYYADLTYADFSNSKMEGTNFGSNDLSNVKGLSTVIHFGPSALGVDTLYRSAGNISEVFLRNCGIPDDFITYLPSLIGTQQAIQFYSCFISYSHRDEEFAKRLYSRMRDEHLRVGSRLKT